MSRSLWCSCWHSCLETLMCWDAWLRTRDMVQNVVEGGWRNKLAYMGLADLQMPIIHTWNVSLNMWNYHLNYRYRRPSGP